VVAGVSYVTSYNGVSFVDFFHDDELAGFCVDPK